MPRTMVQYRRNRIAGGTYFFTVTLQDRSRKTLVEHIDVLRTVFRQALVRRPFTIEAIVVLPDHLHSVWTLPQGDDDYVGRWRFIKSRFTHALAKTDEGLTRSFTGENDLW